MIKPSLWLDFLFAYHHNRHCSYLHCHFHCLHHYSLSISVIVHGHCSHHYSLSLFTLTVSVHGHYTTSRTLLIELHSVNDTSLLAIIARYHWSLSLLIIITLQSLTALISRFENKHDVLQRCFTLTMTYPVL